MSDGFQFGMVQTEGPVEKLIPLYDPSIRDRVFSKGKIRDNELLIFVEERHIESILQHVQKYRNREVGGVFVGGYYEYNTLRYVEICGVIPAAHTVSRGLSLRFTHDTWKDIRQKMEQSFPGERLLGWYHSHPKSGIYFSGNDIFIHENFFSLPWQIAIVADPLQQKIGFFQWKGKSVERCGYYFVSDSLSIV